MSKLYDLLSAMCGKIKKPDWNQNDSTAPDYVKNRPFYQDTVLDISWDGNTEGLEAAEGFPAYKVSETAPEKNDISGSEVVFEKDGVQEKYKVDDIGCQEGENCILVGEFVAISYAENATFGRLIFPTPGVWFLSAGTQFTRSLKKATIKTLDAKYLPDTVATKSGVEAAQTVAENAQTVAENAQTVAEKSKEMLSQMVTSTTAEFTFDKQTSGRDTFRFNDFDYYKISDFNPAPDDVISFTGTKESGANLSDITTGNNCVEYGFFIVVASAGDCSILVGETVRSFTAPSAGLYARYEEGNTAMTAGTAEFTLRGIDGLTIRSSTYGSTKKFRITIDDSGTISATEVT